MCVAAEPKLGKVNFLKIHQASKKVAEATNELQKTMTEAQERIGSLAVAAKAIEEKLAKEGISAKDKAQLEAEFAAKREEYNTAEEEFRLKQSFEQKSYQTAIAGQVKEIVDRIAQQENFAAIFREEMLVSAAGLIDLTDRIAKELDAAPPLRQK
jgi:outer membrane protein